MSFFHFGPSQALILYMYEALRGVKGFVMDEESGLPVGGAQMSVKGRHREFNTTADGEYWRILLNGSYILQVYLSTLSPFYCVFVARFIFRFVTQFELVQMAFPNYLGEIPWGCSKLL